MSDEKKKKSRSKGNRFLGDGALYEYTKRPVIFIAIAMALAIITAFVAIKPLSALVHKAEAYYCINAGDIVVQQDKLYSLEEATPGQAVAKLSVAERGVNTTVFYTLNRTTERAGAGLSAENSLFGDDGTTFIGGYDEGELRSLYQVEAGDRIKVKTADKVMIFEAEEAYFDTKSYKDIKAEGKLVIFSNFSNFSEHKGERFFVIAQKVSEEVITNE